jgi:LEA14-like dessication related protein
MKIKRVWMLSCLLLAACATPKLIAPELQAAGLTLQNVGILQQEFLVTLRVYNPNAVPLPIENIRYQLDLGGTRFAEGESAVAFTIPSRESREFDVRLRTDLLSNLQTLSDWLSGSTGALEYRLVGEVSVDLPFVRPLPFSQAGSIPLRLQAQPQERRSR